MSTTNDYINSDSISDFVKVDSTGINTIAPTYIPHYWINTADDSGLSYSSTNKVDELESKFKYLEDTIKTLEHKILSLESQLKDCTQEKEIEDETLEII